MLSTQRVQELLLTHFSPMVLGRTRTDRVVEDRDGVWFVHTAKGLCYRVQVILAPDDVFLMCNCRNGLRLGNWPACHHAAAVLEFLLLENSEAWFAA